MEVDVFRLMGLSDHSSEAEGRRSRRNFKRIEPEMVYIAPHLYESSGRQWGSGEGRGGDETGAAVCIGGESGERYLQGG